MWRVAQIICSCWSSYWGLWLLIADFQILAQFETVQISFETLDETRENIEENIVKKVTFCCVNLLWKPTAILNISFVINRTFRMYICPFPSLFVFYVLAFVPPQVLWGQTVVTTQLVCSWEPRFTGDFIKIYSVPNLSLLSTSDSHKALN